MLIYELFYGFIYFGVLLSKNTLLARGQNLSLAAQLLLLLVLTSGFFLPYLLNFFKIRLSPRRYLSLAVAALLLYVVGSAAYYANQRDEARFKNLHPFLQAVPPALTAVSPKPPDVYRIICLGGSTTECEYPRLLEAMLAERYPHTTIEVLNGGRFFYSTEHSLIQFLFDLSELQPDLVLFFEAINDLVRSFTQPPYSSSPFRGDYGHFFGFLAHVRYPRTFEQFIADFLYADLRNRLPQPISFDDFKSRHAYRRNLELLAYAVRNSNAALIFANQAHCFDADVQFTKFPLAFLIDKGHCADGQSWFAGMEQFNAIMQTTAAKLDIPFVDQAGAYKDRKHLFVDGVHMTTEGNRLKAALFFDKIVELQLIERAHLPE